MVEDLIPIDLNKMTKQKIQARERERSALSDALRVDNLANHFINGMATGWAVVNAVVDFAEHTPPLEETSTWQERSFDEFAFGENDIVLRAVALVKALA